MDQNDATDPNSVEADGEEDRHRQEITADSDLSDILDPGYHPKTPLIRLEPFEYLWDVTHLLTAQECQYLIDRTQEIGYGRTPYPPKYRGNLRLILNDPNLAAVLWPRINELLGNNFCLHDKNRNRWVPVGLNTRFRFAKYYPGDEFGRHADDCYIDNENNQTSMLTVNIYLNDCNSGATRFYYYATKKGSRPR